MNRLSIFSGQAVVEEVRDDETSSHEESSSSSSDEECFIKEITNNSKVQKPKKIELQPPRSPVKKRNFNDSLAVPAFKIKADVESSVGSSFVQVWGRISVMITRRINIYCRI